MQTFTGNSPNTIFFEHEYLQNASSFNMGGKTKGLVQFFSNYLFEDYICWKAVSDAHRAKSGWFFGYYGGEGFAMVSMGAKFQVTEKVLMRVH